MNLPLPRRQFLKRSGWIGTGLLASPHLSSLRAAEAPGAENRLSVGVMGLGRGMDHVAALSAIPGVMIS